jgi:hypothetical protein
MEIGIIGAGEIGGTLVRHYAMTGNGVKMTNTQKMWSPNLLMTVALMLWIVDPFGTCVDSSLEALSIVPI